MKYYEKSYLINSASIISFNLYYQYYDNNRITHSVHAKRVYRLKDVKKHKM